LEVAATTAAGPSREDLTAKQSARFGTGDALAQGPVRVAIFDGDTGFRLVLARRMYDISWEYSASGKVAPAKRLLAMNLEAVVVDIALLGTGGWRWLKALGAADGRPAIVVCSHPSTSAQRVRALELGADDWLSKPCHPEEVIARVEAIVRQRRRLARATQPIAFGELEIRPGEYQVYVRDQSLKLTRREFQVLEVLAREPHEVLARRRIYEYVWGRTMPREDRSVDVVVHKIRRKLLGASPRWLYIHTHPAVGYSLLVPADDSGQGDADATDSGPAGSQDTVPADPHDPAPDSALIAA
jgi:DNA-binding response OmpR family regulator